MIALLKRFIEYPLGPNWADISGSRASHEARKRSSPFGFDPGRELARIGHAQRRAFVRSTARQIRSELGLPPDNRLAG